MNDRATGRDVIDGLSKLTSQRQFASVRERARCIESCTVGGSLGPFDCDKAAQNITQAPGTTQIADIDQRSKIDYCLKGN